MDYRVQGILQARILELVAIPFSRESSQPRGWTPALWADSLPAEPQGKPKNTGVDSLSLLHWLFPTQESNWGLLHCRWILYQLSHKGSPRILEWVAYPFSIGFSWPRNRTRVSCIVGGCFTNWATREAPWVFPEPLVTLGRALWAGDTWGIEARFQRIRLGMEEWRLWVLMEKRITVIVSKVGEKGRFVFHFQITSMLLGEGNGTPL